MKHLTLFAFAGLLAFAPHRVCAGVEPNAVLATIEGYYLIETGSTQFVRKEITTEKVLQKVAEVNGVPVSQLALVLASDEDVVMLCAVKKSDGSVVDALGQSTLGSVLARPVPDSDSKFQIECASTYGFELPLLNVATGGYGDGRYIYREGSGPDIVKCNVRIVNGGNDGGKDVLMRVRLKSGKVFPKFVPAFGP